MNLAMLLPIVFVTTASLAWAGMEEDVARIRQDWERIKYQTPVKEQEAAFEKLAKESEKTMQAYAKSAEPAIWHGIVEASYAGAKGGLGALSLVKNARKSFEAALGMNANALDGSAYTSLGSLYYQVPGWPIGFGDEKKALELLLKGLSINPNGIDPNYFYGDYLFRTGDYAGAEQALQRALKAAPREGRRIADEGRRKEIAELLEKIRDKKR